MASFLSRSWNVLRLAQGAGRGVVTGTAGYAPPLPAVLACASSPAGAVNRWLPHPAGVRPRPGVASLAASCALRGRGAAAKKVFPRQPGPGRIIGREPTVTVVFGRMRCAADHELPDAGLGSPVGAKRARGRVDIHAPKRARGKAHGGSDQVEHLGQHADVFQYEGVGKSLV